MARISFHSASAKSTKLAPVCRRPFSVSRIAMARPAATSPGQLAVDQPLGHQPHQPLAHRRRRDLHGVGQFSDAQRTRLAQQVEDADVGAFGDWILMTVVIEPSYEFAFAHITILADFAHF